MTVVNIVLYGKQQMSELFWLPWLSTVRGSSKNLPIAPTKLQHSQPSILPIGHHPHNIPKDDPPAYTAARHRPTGADTISMSSINTANTDNDADTLRGNKHHLNFSSESALANEQASFMSFWLFMSKGFVVFEKAKFLAYIFSSIGG